MDLKRRVAKLCLLSILTSDCFRYPVRHMTPLPNTPPNLTCFTRCSGLGCNANSCRSYISQKTQTATTATRTPTQAPAGHTTTKVPHLAPQSSSNTGNQPITTLGVYRVQSNLTCLKCHHVLNPTECEDYKTCRPGESCSALVHKIGNTNYFDLDCRKIEDCFHYAVGRHHLPLPPNYSTDLKCSKCCNNNGCNKHECFESYPYISHSIQAVPKSTRAPTRAPTIRTTTKAPLLAPQLPFNTGNQLTTTPAPTPNCRDHEEDGIGCAMLDLYNLCTDKSVLGYVTAHKKCPKHCGFCTPTTKLHTPPATPHPSGVCRDYEQDGLPCASLRAYGLCTDTSTFAFVLSHKKCQKYCGLCQSSSGSPASANGNSPPLHQLIVSTLPSSSSTTTTASKTMAFSATPIGANTIITKALITTTAAAKMITSSPTLTTISSMVPSVSTGTANKHTTKHNSLFPCVDFEDSTFSCAIWTSHGYCNQIPGIGYETAKLRCRKFCGFC